MKGLVGMGDRLNISDQALEQLGKKPLTPAERAAKKEQDRLAREADKASKEAAKKAEEAARAEYREEKKAQLREAEESDSKLEAVLNRWAEHNASVEPVQAKIRQLTHVISEDLKSLEELDRRIIELQQRKERIELERNRKIDERTVLQTTTHKDTTELTASLKVALVESNLAWSKIQPAKRKELRNRKAKRQALELLGPEAPSSTEE